MASKESKISMVALVISLIMVVIAFSLAILFCGVYWLSLWSVLSVIIPVLIIWASLAAGITMYTKRREGKM